MSDLPAVLPETTRRQKPRRSRRLRALRKGNNNPTGETCDEGPTTREKEIRRVVSWGESVASSDEDTSRRSEVTFNSHDDVISIRSDKSEPLHDCFSLWPSGLKCLNFYFQVLVTIIIIVTAIVALFTPRITEDSNLGS